LVKHELVEGFPHALAGASDRHNRVVVNLVLALGPLARKKGCRLYASDMRLKVDAATVYYPDLMVICMVICEEDAGEHYKEKPCLVIEVLSESTEATDRREKLRKYLGLPTLQAYLLVDSRTPPGLRLLPGGRGLGVPGGGGKASPFLPRGISGPRRGLLRALGP